MKRNLKTTACCRYISFVALFSLICTGITVAQSTNQNYIVTRTLRIDGVKTDAELRVAAGDKNKIQATIQYVDGLGRPLQTIQREASPLGYDIVQHFAYDTYGRDYLRYLPYAPTTGTKGTYRTSTLTALNAFYATPPAGVVQIPSGQTTYGNTKLEASPLSRPLEQGAPGLNWKIGGGHTVRTTYEVNKNSDAIKQWEISVSGGASYSKSYDESSLTKATVKDENGNATIIFKDKDNQIVCRKVQSGATSYLTTDYIYDDFGNLRYVIPPLPIAAGSNPAIPVPTSFTESDNVFLNFFYAYHYDGLMRPVDKKLPGQGWRYMVYNNKDQLILSQDANQRLTNIWIVNKYDVLGRVVITGEYYDATSSRQALQNIADASAVDLYETFTNSATFYGYSHTAWPDISTGANNKVLSVQYYDTYDILGNSSVNPNSSIFTAPNVSVDSLERFPNGQIIATLTNILKTSTYLFSVMHYDLDGKLVKTISQHYQGLTLANNKYDSEENSYGFQSLLTKSVRKHYLPASSSPILTINNWITYDHRDRPALRKQQYITATNTGAITTISKSEYNEIGQLMVKHLHSTNIAANPANNTFLQHIDYLYNSHGWLTKLNDPNNLTDTQFGTTTDLFAEQLDYDQLTNSYTGGVPQYNGNVSTIKWQTKQPTLPQEAKGYVFNYDPVNRLTSANYKSTTSGDNLYNEALTYDELGNILTLNRNNGSSVLNNMVYGYSSAGVRSNKLQAITDSGSGSEPQATTYSYNNHGSLTGDTRKTINNIEYNELGLPFKISITASNKTINYTYDSFGNKLARVIKLNGTVAEERVYDDDIEYVGNAIDFIHNNEGRVLPSIGAYVFEYSIADHLGNIRVTFGDKNNDGSLDNSEVLQIVDYYAFGRPIVYSQTLTPSPDNNYKYGAKEYLKDIAEYDFGFRLYDPVIGRWNVIDPASETARAWTPYRYGFNNPTRFTDAMGLYEWTGAYGDVHDSKYDAGSVSYFDFGQGGSVFWGHNFGRDKFEGGNKVPGTDSYYKDYSGGGGQGPQAMKILYVFEVTTPWIYEHIDYAHKNLGKPLLLNYLGAPFNKPNRRVATKDWRDYKRPFSWSVDEYPFASTLEGGFGASTALVPAVENSIQGGQIKGLQLKKGDLLLVKLVPNPEKERVPVLQKSPQNNYIPTYAPVRIHKSAVVVGGALGITVAEVVFWVLFAL
jgi:RHS repeat-associated protein